VQPAGKATAGGAAKGGGVAAEEAAAALHTRMRTIVSLCAFMRVMRTASP